MPLPPLLRLMRPQQWTKNAFVVAPLFFSGYLFDSARCVAALAAAVAFCGLSSLVYVINDLCDREADRLHIKNRARPIAAGTVSCGAALALAGLLAALTAALVLVSDPPATVRLSFALYLGINLAYSLGLKHVPLVEMILVSSGFVLRLQAGAGAIETVISGWMLACTSLVVLLLVALKRRADLQQGNDPGHHRRVLSAYSVTSLDLLAVFLAATAVATYVAFSMSADGRTRYGDLLPLTSAFVVVGVLRFLHIAMIEQGGDNPSETVTQDRILRLAFLAWACSFFVLIYANDAGLRSVAALTR